MEREFPDDVSESSLLNLFKDIGIGAATLIILGRLMVKLVQAAIEFFHGLREDNQARNSHFATLLAVNQAIAGQMELTRQTLERAHEHDLRHLDALHAHTVELSAVRQEMTKGFDAARLQSVEDMAVIEDQHDAFASQLADMSRDVVSSLAVQVGAADTHIVETVHTAMTPVLQRLDGMRLDLAEMRQAILDGLEQLIHPQASSDPVVDQGAGVAPNSPHPSFQARRDP